MVSHSRHRKCAHLPPASLLLHSSSLLPSCMLFASRLHAATLFQPTQDLGQAPPVELQYAALAEHVANGGEEPQGLPGVDLEPGGRRLDGGGEVQNRVGYWGISAGSMRKGLEATELGREHEADR